MNFQKVPVTQSIGVDLFKKVFSLYFIAAIIITLFQGWLEYTQTKDRVIFNVVKYQPLVEDALANAVWHFDNTLLNSLIEGLLTQATITGVGIYNEDGTVIAQKGTIEKGTTTFPQSRPTDTQDHTSFALRKETYQHHFALFSPNNFSSAPIAWAVFYTNDAVVINNVQPTLISLLIAAFIKTTILWIVFLYYSQKMLRTPLTNLINMVRKLPIEKGDEDENKHKLGNNELELFEHTLTKMSKKLQYTLTELRDSNKKLGNINSQLMRAVEQSPTVSTILSHDGKVTYTTPSFTSLTGFNCDEAQTLFDRHFEKVSFKSIVNKFENITSPTELLTSVITVIDKNNCLIYLAISLSPVYGDDGKIESFLCSANDISALKHLEIDLKQKNIEQQETILKLKEAQEQLIQSEKMASIGQLSAGIAHEINNPVGFINSNIDTLNQYLINLFELINVYEKEVKKLPDNITGSKKYRQDIDFLFISEDIPAMMTETKEGLSRVTKIVRDLMDFSHVNDTQLVIYDIRKGLESTLNVAWHELKYKSEIIKEFDDIPDIECIPSQLNQVFMNLMVNAAQALNIRGTIILRTKHEKNQVIIEIEDNGSGIKPENLKRLFEPFFTTKPIGTGTGLGLSVSYSIIKNHNGEIIVNSQLNKGTCFRICLPISQPAKLKDPMI
jgi:PAS domain S-box-containing protein